MPSNPGFQTFVNNELPVGVAGDWAGANIRASVLGGGPATYIAAAGGVTVGCFAWFNPTTGIASNYWQGSGCLLGFIHRENNALITTFLGFAAAQVLQGNQITGFSQGDFWANFASGGTAGQKVYTDPVYGICTAAATGGSVTNSVATSSLANTGVLTTGTVTGAAIAPGMAVIGAGIPLGSYILSGATTTWQLANVVPIASGSWPVAGSETITMSGIQETPWYLGQTVPASAIATGSSISATGLLTVGTVTQGNFVPGQFITGAAGLPATANCQLLYYVTGTGGTGSTIQTNYQAVVASTTITGVQGSLAKITNWASGTNL
jgi:hypothetical protein